MEIEAQSQLGRALIKQLACCNKGTRDKALRSLLKTWLPSLPADLPDDDAKKLWKGLFYCFWHSDKPIPQSDLANRLSSLLLSLSLPLSLQYLSTFLLTMRREWPSIDALRLDKFYLLIRRFVSNLFSLLKKNSWDLELVRRFVEVFDKSTFSAEDRFQGNGVNYHVATVFIEELRPFLPLRVEVLKVLFEPFFAVMGRVSDRVLLGKVRSGLFDVLLKNGKRLLEARKVGEEVGDGDDVVVLGTVALAMGFSGRFYEIGSAPGCCQGNRKILFGLHEEFLKLEKDAAATGFEFKVPDVVDEDEEVPVLVPIGNGNGMEVDEAEGEGVANGKQLRKCKKDKKGLDNDGKKKKKKNKKKKGEAENESENLASENGGNPNDEQVDGEGTIHLNEAVISNLQKQFEKIAAEAGLDDGVASACDAPEATSTGTVSKKRKRTKNMKGKASQDSELNGGDAEDNAAVAAKSGEKSAKKVRFSMKNNLVWVPHCPLPPQSLRLPPSATPRGSALKQGVPPGPIREMLPSTKKPKLKRARKALKGVVVPNVKRLKKLRSRSA